MSDRDKHVMCAKPWPPCEDPFDKRRWIISEKLDGMRAVWRQDSSTKEYGLYTRTGKCLDIPPWFTDGFPQKQLDGELYIGPKQFQKLMSLIKRKTKKEDEWFQEGLRFHVFDAPDAPNTSKKYTERIEEVRKLKDAKFLQKHPASGCNNQDDLKTFLHNVEAKGGEGVMLRDCDGVHQIGRSNYLFKLKSYGDAEADVIDHIGDKSNPDRIVALRCRTSAESPTTFLCSTGYCHDKKLLPGTNTRITFRCLSWSSDGLPVFPVYHRIFEDS